MEQSKNLRDRLQENNLTFVWLINILRQNGYSVDKSEMSSAVNGTISGKKAETIIEKSHLVMDKYDDFARSVVV